MVYTKGRWQRGEGPEHLLNIFIKVGVKLKKIVMEDNNQCSGGDIQSRSLIGVGPGHT